MYVAVCARFVGEPYSCQSLSLKPKVGPSRYNKSRLTISVAHRRGPQSRSPAGMVHPNHFMLTVDQSPFVQFALGIKPPQSCSCGCNGIFALGVICRI